MLGSCFARALRVLRVLCVGARAVHGALERRAHRRALAQVVRGAWYDPLRILRRYGVVVPV